MFSLGNSNIDLLSTFRKLPDIYNDCVVKVVTDVDLSNKKDKLESALSSFHFDNVVVLKNKKYSIQEQNKVELLTICNKTKQHFIVPIHILNINGNVERKNRSRGNFKFEGIPVFGIKVYDIVKIFTDIGDNSNLEKHELSVINKILKSCNNDEYTGVLFSLIFPDVTLVESKSSDRSISNFSDKIVLFPGATEISHLISKNEDVKNVDKKITGVVSSMLSKINIDIIRYIINMYFSNIPYSSNNKYHKFNKPKQLIKILEKYHGNNAVYHSIKNMIKENSTRTCSLQICSKRSLRENSLEKVTFNSIKNFSGKQSDIYELENYDKLYFMEWDELRDFSTLEHIYETKRNLKVKRKEKRVRRTSWDMCNRDNKFDYQKIKNLLRDADLVIEADDYWGSKM